MERSTSRSWETHSIFPLKKQTNYCHHFGMNFIRVREIIKCDPLLQQPPKKTIVKPCQKEDGKHSNCPSLVERGLVSLGQQLLLQLKLIPTLDCASETGKVSSQLLLHDVWFRESLGNVFRNMVKRGGGGTPTANFGYFNKLSSPPPPPPPTSPLLRWTSPFNFRC